MKKNKFTMLELIVVVTIISVMVAVSAPRLAGFYKSTKLKSTARQLAALINYTRELAVTERKTCRLMLNDEGNVFIVQIQSDPVDNPEDFINLEGQTGYLKMPPSIGIELEGDGDGNTDVNPEVAAGSTVYKLSNDTDEIQVSIKPGSGRAVISN